MRIIIDGVDGSGKTTLINTIAEKTGWPVIKFSAPKTNNPFKEWKEYYEPKNEKYIGDNVILDRCWISEVMYGPIKGRPKLTQEQIDYFKNKTKNDLYIISQASKDFIKNAFDTRGEDYINLEEAIEINRKYLEFTNRNKLGKRFYYYYPEFVKKDNIEHYFNSYIKEHYEKSKNN